MADNTTLNTGTGGDVIATDDIGGVKFPRTKLVHGADGVNDGDVSDANPLPVTDNHSSNLLMRILQMLMAPLGYDKTLGRQRGTVILESGTVTSVNSVSTVSAVTNIAGVGGYPAQMQIIDANRAAWELSHRSRIT